MGGLADFQRFVRLLAAHASQTLNMSKLAKVTGVSVPTIKRWVSILEASYIIFLLPPYFNNLGKRLVKSPKLYFYDTGFLSYLLGIGTNIPNRLSPLQGPVFENYIVSQIIKKNKHQGRRSEFYYLRTQDGLEVDLIVDFGEHRHWIEIKHSSTFNVKMLKTIHTLLPEGDKGFLLYSGETRPYHSNMFISSFGDYLLEEID